MILTQQQILDILSGKKTQHRVLVKENHGYQVKCKVVEWMKVVSYIY